MNSNTHSTRRSAGHPTSRSTGRSDPLAALASAVDQLAAQNLDGLPDAVAAEQVLALRRLLDRLEGHWLKELATVEARGAAGAEDGIQAPSTAGWLRNRLRMGATAATSQVRTARALFRGPLTQTGQAVIDGAIAPAHASVLTHGTHDLPAHTAAKAEPVLLEAAQRLDPPRLRRVVAHLQQAADPEAAEARAEHQQQRRGLWLAATPDGMVAIDGLLDPEAGQTLLAALDPLTRPHSAQDERSGGQRRADALTELARRTLEGGHLPKTGGVRPQLSVVVGLESLLDPYGGLGGDAGWAGPLAPEACRRLACDGAVTRVVVSRHPTNPHGPCGHDHPDDHNPDGHSHPDGHGHPESHHGPCRPGHHPNGGGAGSLAEWLGTAAALLPPVLGGAPSQPLDLGRTTRVITPSQRLALAVRDGGCVFPDCARPLAWCEGHHVWHWLDGGPTDLANLVLLCRAHHRAVHEGGWQLVREPDGRLTASPPHRQHRHRRHPAAA